MLVILDWDGTLINSSDKIVSCMQAAAVELSLEPRSADAVRNIIGLGLAEAIGQLYPGIGHADSEAFRAAYSRLFVEADQTPCAFFPRVPETLAALKEEGYRIAVATGKSRRGLTRVLVNLGMDTFFDASRCADETRSKPDPLMLMELCEELRVAPAEAVMVGDTEYDMAMAAAVEMPRIGVSYGVHEPVRLQRWRPLAVLNSFDQVRKYLRAPVR